MANVCCSIELEPRTLKQGQLDQAREVAVDIFHKKELNEASNIVIEGLKPVAAIKEIASALVVQETNKLKKEEDYSMENKSTNINKGISPCQCSCNTSSPILDSPDQSKLKEPLSAPF